jgi:hypothetical protein
MDLRHGDAGNVERLEPVALVETVLQAGSTDTRDCGRGGESSEGTEGDGGSDAGQRPPPRP